eukprot:274671-Prorocentrum_minimum.AAC.1
MLRVTESAAEVASTSPTSSGGGDGSDEPRVSLKCPQSDLQMTENIESNRECPEAASTSRRCAAQDSAYPTPSKQESNASTRAIGWAFRELHSMERPQLMDKSVSQVCEPRPVVGQWFEFDMSHGPPLADHRPGL